MRFLVILTTLFSVISADEFSKESLKSVSRIALREKGQNTAPPERYLEDEVSSTGDGSELYSYSYSYSSSYDNEDPGDEVGSTGDDEPQFGGESTGDGGESTGDGGESTEGVESESESFGDRISGWAVAFWGSILAFFGLSHLDGDIDIISEPQTVKGTSTELHQGTLHSRPMFEHVRTFFTDSE